MSYIMPAEWAPHKAVWIGFPSIFEYWGAALPEAQRQIAAFADAVYDDGRGETVYLIAANNMSAMIAREMVGPNIIVEERHIGDIWLRDTAPIIVKDGNRYIARNFGFNGWGNRYNYDGDTEIGAILARDANLKIGDCDWILEGGSIDVDGQGLAVTTADCLLNPNRNPGMGAAEIEDRLKRDLGINRLLWLGEGLANDHTDGHVDNLARFVAPNHLVIPRADGEDDPNHAIYEDAIKKAEAFGCTVTPMPSVGRLDQDGVTVPASYMNFYIGNSVVIVPTYGVPNDGKALQAFEHLFVGRRIIGLPANAVLTGGGSFHCSSQQIPA